MTAFLYFFRLATVTVGIVISNDEGLNLVKFGIYTATQVVYTCHHNQLEAP